MAVRKRRALWLLAAAGAGGTWFLWRHRELVRLLSLGFRLCPEHRLAWSRTLWRLILACREGIRFADRYPYAYRNLAYGSHPRQQLDVFRPAGTAGRPVLFFVHGGGWESGGKWIYSAVAREFVALGYVVVLINYRMHPQVHFPAFVQDAASALHWVVNHISEYGGDPRVICLAGHSAGAHIVALLGLDSRFLMEAGIDPAVIRGVVGMSGPYDLPALADYVEDMLGPRGGESHLATIMGGAENLAIASPVRYARPDAPPMLLLHGRQDSLVPYRQAKALARAMTEAGSCVRLELLEETDHISILLDLFGRPPECRFPVGQAIDRFLRPDA